MRELGGRGWMHLAGQIIPVGPLPLGEALHDRVEQRIPGAEAIRRRADRHASGRVDRAMRHGAHALLPEQGDRRIKQLLATTRPSRHD